MDKAEKKSYLEKFCDVTERGDEFYVKFNRDVFYETLKKRHGKVLDAMKKHSLRSEHAEGISKVDIFLSGGQFCIFFSKVVRDIDLILFAS